MLAAFKSLIPQDFTELNELTVLAESYPTQSQTLLSLPVGQYVTMRVLNRQGCKNLITQYEQLMGTALLKNEAAGPGQGEFKKLPIYGRRGNRSLETKLNNLNIKPGEEEAGRTHYLSLLKQYHESMTGDFKRMSKNAVANISDSQLRKLMEHSELAPDPYFTGTIPALPTAALPTGGATGRGGGRYKKKRRTKKRRTKKRRTKKRRTKNKN